MKIKEFIKDMLYLSIPLWVCIGMIIYWLLFGY